MSEANITGVRKLTIARQQPNLCLVAFSITDTLAEIKAALFADLSQEVSIHFVSRGPLACVCTDTNTAHIYIHQLLNHPETPREVVSFICKHELLHLRIPSIDKEGREIPHSPEFWKAEKAVSPERKKAWAWIWTNLGSCLRRRPRLERIDVLPRWRKVWSDVKVDVETCQKVRGRTEESVPTGSRMS